MTYIMALEVQGDSGGVTVTREVILDFSPYQTREVAADDGTLYNSYEKMVYVSDHYVLTNPADRPITLDLAYPMLVWANELSGGALTLLADGEILQPAYGSSRVAVEEGNWNAVGNMLTDEADKALAMRQEGLDDDTGEFLYMRIGLTQLGLISCKMNKFPSHFRATNSFEISQN